MKLCGKELSIGDFVKVEYTTGTRLKGSTIKGKIVEFTESHKQARVESGWCFHDHDLIIKHVPKTEE